MLSQDVLILYHLDLLSLARLIVYSNPPWLLHPQAKGTAISLPADLRNHKTTDDTLKTVTAAMILEPMSQR